MNAKKSHNRTKTPKPLTTKKAPEATDSHAAVDDWSRRVMPDLHPIVGRLDELIWEPLHESESV